MATRDDYIQLARAAASRYGFDPNVYVRQIDQESGFNPNAVSPAGAQGIAQFMPGTAAGVGLKNPFDPAAALDAGAKYMAGLLSRFGSMPLALAAYNAGGGNVEKYGGIPPFKETQNYVNAILGGATPAASTNAPAAAVASSPAVAPSPVSPVAAQQQSNSPLIALLLGSLTGSSALTPYDELVKR